jgi:glycosyltransferase involved in cell wall biosynthesis
VNILYLSLDRGIPVLGGKGAAVHVRSMVAALRRLGHSVTVAAPRLVRGDESPAPLDAEVIEIPGDPVTAEVVERLRRLEALVGGEPGLEREVRRVLFNDTAVAQLLPRLRENPPDAIYERICLLGTAGHDLARTLGVPHILEVNAPLALEADAYRRLHLGELARRAEATVIAGATAVLAVSRAAADHAVAVGGHPDRVHVVPNAIDADLFRPRPADPALRRSLGAGDDDVLLGFVGGLRPWHGVESLPALADRLLAAGVPARLVIAGDGPMRRQIEEDLAGRGIADRTVLTGAVPHDRIARIVSELDIALAPYPPLDHAFYFSPLKLFEYMGAGAAVVAADLGQISEVVDDGVTGLLHPPGDLDAMTERCLRLARDPELRRRLGAAAAEVTHASRTWEHNARAAVALARGAAQP